jgi:hypothetical protein
LTGDVLLAAGQIAYLGPFTAVYRSDILRDWVAACQVGLGAATSQRSLIHAEKCIGRLL